jgi:hypothetical protein
VSIAWVRISRGGEWATGVFDGRERNRSKYLALDPREKEWTLGDD